MRMSIAVDFFSLGTVAAAQDSVEGNCRTAVLGWDKLGMVVSGPANVEDSGMVIFNPHVSPNGELFQSPIN